MWFSYKAALPDIFVLVHPVGTVIGHVNVEFNDYLVILQNATINSQAGGRLILGKGLCMTAGSQIIGGGEVGDWCTISANTTVRNPNLDSHTLVYRDDTTGKVMTKSHSGHARTYFLPETIR